jgi:hypothetical protein
MSRRSALPGADELFRSTGDLGRPRAEEQETQDAVPTGVTAPAAAPRQDRGDPGVTALAAVSAAPAPSTEAASEGLEEAAAAVQVVPRRRARSVADRRPSGRERHDEKITVYVSAEELMDLEHARLALRGDFGLSVDRGRVVREALAVVLADLEAKGEASILVRRLRGR